MNAYVKSSAVLAWLFGEPAGGDVRLALTNAELLISSDITIVECHRALHRAVAAGAMDEARAANLGARLASAIGDWHVMRVTPSIVERASRPFSGEPIRTLDALHVASALEAKTVISDLAMLSLDDRVRRVARGLGLDVIPDDRL